MNKWFALASLIAIASALWLGGYVANRTIGAASNGSYGGLNPVGAGGGGCCGGGVAAGQPGPGVGNSNLNADGTQVVDLKVEGGYSPGTLVVKKGVPLTININRPESNNPCSKWIIFPDFGIQKDLPDNGKTTIQLNPDRAGEYTFYCGMQMIVGKLKVEA